MTINWLIPAMNFDENQESGSGTVSPPAESGGTPESGTPTPPSSGEAPQTDDSTPGPGESDPFSGMEDDLDVIDLGVQDEPKADEARGQPAPKAAAGKGEPKPAGEVPPAPTPPEAKAPAEPAAAPTQDGPSAPQSKLEFAIEGFKTNEAALTQWASQNLFALSKEESEALDTDAVAEIPKLMGRVYAQAMQATVNMIKNFVPEMVQSGVAAQQQRAAKATEALNEFYATNKHLNPTAHGAAVEKWARAFRSANPGASRQQAIEFVGRAVSSEFGVMPGQGNGAAPPKRPAPFAPARPGARAPTAPSQGHDPYAGMEDEYD